MNPLAKHGRLSYFEIPAVDARRSATFYEQLFGWRVDHHGGNDFRFSDGEGTMIGRWAIDRVPSREAGLMPFIYVDGLDAAMTRVAANGGEIVKPPYPEGDVRVATVRDPAGNLIGLWQFAAGG
jgi:predicted enzyme related to lactoylglutathione lyase